MTSMMKRLDVMGMTFIFIEIVIGQLIWVFDPLRFGKHMYWIEAIEVAWVFVTIPFVVWVISASLGILRILKEWTAREGHPQRYVMTGTVIFIRLCIAISSIISVMLILFNREQIFELGIWVAIAVFLVMLHWLVTNKAWKTVALWITIWMIVLYPTSYMLTYPGLTMDMNQYALVDTGHPEAEIIGVLIFERPAFPIDWLYAQLFAHYDLVKRSKTALPIREQLQQVRAMKLDANQVGSAVAFQKLGLGQGSIPRGVKIIQVVQDGPAYGNLQVTDHIIAINEQSVQTMEQLLTYMQSVKPDSKIELTIQREMEKDILKDSTEELTHQLDKAADKLADKASLSEQVTVTITTQASSTDANRAVIGIVITDDIELDLPLDVTFTPYWLHEGGPSHGAMLTLSLIDQLTPGGVTQGNQVAGTGTIDIHGNIGRIGGIEQKAFTVARAGADVFFVPRGQETEARKGSDRLRIVPVATIEEILTWLQDHPKTR